MSDAASDPSPSQNSTPTRATAYDDPVLETGQAKVAAKGGLLHHALRLARWLVRKFNELLIISLIAIPLGQLFLESQLKQQQQAARSEFLHNLVFVYEEPPTPNPFPRSWLDIDERFFFFAAAGLSGSPSPSFLLSTTSSTSQGIDILPE